MSAADTRPGLLLWHLGRRGGGPRYTYELAQALARRDDLRLHLALSRQSLLFERTAALGLPTLGLDTYDSAGSLLRALPRLPAVARRMQDYVRQNRLGTAFCAMTHLWNPVLLPALRRAGAHNALVVHDAAPHAGDRLPALRRWLIRRDLAGTDTVAVLSQAVQAQLAQNFGVAPDSTVLFPHAGFAYGDPPPLEGRRLQPGRPLRLLFFGRLLPYKGLHLLLDAYRQLRAAGTAVELTLAGQGSLAGLELPPEVRVVARWIEEDEVPPLFAAADAVVLPYIEASQSGVLAIALPLGLPAIVTPIGALPEQIGHGQAGLIAATATAPAIAAAVQRLEDPALYNSLSRGALAEAAASMDWDKVAARVAQLAAR